MRYTLDIHEDDPDEAKNIGKAFKAWMRDKFSTWDDTVLQHFLYENNIVQNEDDDRLVLEGHLEKIVKDDCSTFIESDNFDETIDDPTVVIDKDTSSSEVRVDEVVPSVGDPGVVDNSKK